MIKWNRLLSIILLIHQAKSSNKWCRKNLCNGQHVLCTDNGKIQSTCPRDATAMVKMSQDMKNLIVDQHNEYRNKFAGGLDGHPKAARMTTMEWDSQLAKVADALVRRCQPIRDECGKTLKYHQGEASYSLEKYYCMTTKKNALKKQLNYWFDPNSTDHTKRLFFSLKEQDQEFSKNYFQVLRDRSNRVGCAIIEYIHPSLVHQLLKCVYNCGVSLCEDNHNPVYEQTDSEPTSECRKGANQRYKNLCHKDELVKSCDGGNLFVLNGHEEEDVLKFTKYPLPHYSNDPSLPEIPDNPLIEVKSKEDTGSSRRNDHNIPTKASTYNTQEATTVIDLSYTVDFDFPDIPDNPILEVRSAPHKAKRKPIIEKNNKNIPK
ncbi:venom allergen 5.01 [Drosophila elegans]|uniref:venom allergen 5.01 n=1 Tax=Drosophila elegans TaxID=30023 RepID=UPI0007E83475|nr:venom allergen 5.01 [Drosophila elegans]